MVEDVVIDDARATVIRQATYQAESMLRALHSYASEDAESLPYLVQGMAPRLLQIVSVIMSAVNDALEPTNELESRLREPF